MYATHYIEKRLVAIYLFPHRHALEKERKLVDLPNKDSMGFVGWLLLVLNDSKSSSVDRSSG